MAMVSLSKTLGQRLRASPSEVPWFTSRLIDSSARLNIGSFCWPAIRSMLRTIGTPAFTRAAILLAKTALSLMPGLVSISSLKREKFSF